MGAEISACLPGAMITIKQGSAATSLNHFTPSRAVAALGGVAVFWGGVAAAGAVLLSRLNAIAVVSGIAGFWGGVVGAGAIFMVFAAARREPLVATHGGSGKSEKDNVTPNNENIISSKPLTVSSVRCGNFLLY